MLSAKTGVMADHRPAPSARVKDFMTPDPHWIGIRENLAAAERQMKKLRVRQLPVLHEGKLRGIISERDVSLVRSLELDPSEVNLSEALAVEPYTVSPEAPLGRVVRAMAAHRYNCAVVVRDGQVRGILTATDGLRALAQLLDRYEPDEDRLAPSQVRELVLCEHAHLRQLLSMAIEHARAVLSGGSDEDAFDALRDSARAACTAMVEHTMLEDRKLAPVLETIDAWGAVRAEQLRQEHNAQRVTLERALANLADASGTPAVLAASIEDVLLDVLKDMEHEEGDLLRSDLFCDDVTQPDADGG